MTEYLYAANQLSMEPIDAAVRQLFLNDMQPVVETHATERFEWKEIVWTDAAGNACFIYEENIAADGENLAWFQSDDHDHHLLQVYRNGTVFSWVPETYNPVFGCSCALLEWHEDRVLFIYREKHDVYICIADTGEVRYFHFHGEKLRQKGNMISFETYTGKPPGKVRVIRIPELVEVEPLSVEEAETMGLQPDAIEHLRG